ncbi:MAG: glycoside hydrolase family 15 [Bacteroidota bacterium]|nr:glycoside hydrolase family 15 [Bacteroidota bacterium]
MAKETLYEIWAKRNPKFETRFESILFREFTEYGGGSVESMASRGKIFGSGYELYIYAYFVGLYANKQRAISSESKVLGQPIQYWGNLESKKLRKAYPKLRDFIFTSLIAKTEKLDLIELEKGNITERKSVDFLIETMENYANYGFYLMEEKIKDNPNFFFRNTGFLNLILSIVRPSDMQGDESDLIEEL